MKCTMSNHRASIPVQHVEQEYRGPTMTETGMVGIRCKGTGELFPGACWLCGGSGNMPK